MNSVLKGYLQLMRPANLPTAAADILAGAAIAGILLTSFPLLPLLFLVGASVLLYAGGVVLNDVFDFNLDTIERPERPLPSGLIKLRSAAIFGGALLVGGILLAFRVNELCGYIAAVLACAIVTYDGFSKNYNFLGPLNMGFCRSLNLFLGMAVLGEITAWWYGIIPLVYIFAITLISRGEVHGNNRNHIIWAGILYALVIFGVLTMVYFDANHLWQAVLFLLLFAFMIFRPLINAYRKNSPSNIKKAVIAGVLALIILDAALAVGFSEWWYGVLILLLFPLSLLLAKLFAVT